MSDDAANNRLALKRIRADINRILGAWDPLALRGLRNGLREYEQYSGPLAIMSKKGEDAMAIARHLEDLLTREWGLPSDRARCVEVARKIYNAGAIFRGEPPLKEGR